MPDITDTLEYLLSQGTETEVLEFKTASNNYDFRKLGKYFSALSNEANLRGKKEAWLVFGVKPDNRTVVGTNYRRDAADLQSLKHEISNKTTERITFIEIHEVVAANGKRVVMFQIPPAPSGIPVAWSGHYYGREGESTGALNPNEYERIRAQRIEDDWSIQICENATVEDLSEAAVLRARGLFAIKNPHLQSVIRDWDDITFLNKAKICVGGKISRTAVLLLGKPESEHFLSPGLAKISWILQDRDNIEKDYAHFSCPFLFSVDEAYAKIRNLKYRYIREETLFPDEVDSYDPYIIREALNNCIAHQDYSMGGKIIIVEREDSQLVFTNLGLFIPGSIEKVIQADAPESRYRNAFLANAMVNLNMIDTIGSGIKRMFQIQKNKFFPLPEYDLGNNQVKVTVTGKVLDLNYARKLAQMPKLSLEEIMLLDKVQKGNLLDDTEIKHLRKKRLVEGRKPNFHISMNVASKTEQRAEYLRLKGMNDDYLRKMIIDYLKKFGEGRRADFETLLMDKISDALDETQKKNKIKNLLQSMRNVNKINCIGKSWRMSKPD